MPLLEIECLSRSFGGLRAVNDVCFSVAPGAIKALIGPNGAGKTTLFNIISGLLRRDSGSVRFKGQPIENLPPHCIARRGILRTFQNVRLFHGMSVIENIMVGMHRRSRAGWFSAMLNLPHTWSEERRLRAGARAAIEFVGLDCAPDSDVGALSFGQQRAVELARALAAEPELLLLDEPAAGLNIQETRRLGDLIRLVRSRGATVLIVEHDMSLVMEISDEVVVLNEGRKIAEGPPSEIQRNPDVVRVYLGDEHA